MCSGDDQAHAPTLTAVVMAKAKRTPEKKFSDLKKLPQTVRSVRYVLDAVQKTDKAYNQMMQVAKKAPLMQNKSYRAKRGIKNSTIFTWASGAAEDLAAEAFADAQKLRQDVLPEDVMAPYLPQVTEGAAVELSEKVCAYVQELFDAAVTIKNGFKKHEKVSESAAQAAASVVNARLAAATSVVPMHIPSITYAKKKTHRPSSTRNKKGKVQEETQTKDE